VKNFKARERYADYAQVNLINKGGEAQSPESWELVAQL